MRNVKRRAGLLVYPLTVLFLLAGLVTQTAVAGIVGTETVLAEQSAGAERARLQAMLDRQDVQEQLIGYGVSPEEAAERVAALTDAEAIELAQRIDELPAGGVTTVLLVIIILLLVLR
ncbi:hypothetical protein CAI21_10105 [Alkalilimnicola ehrlichii]|uniref:PA2779 family protein n=1 Tax=Alkalilimnicola ehrlichii TaxID=351052 RepID=A0A3E0WID7_9GAMM|nr:PA2779 family protein [Alkalilimnicola ehrlichii]RFA29403.1 hypothetical protein CAI21_10105 [Alkalilimnicola ehrlichii]RFA31921.1 hypothetical protein CAL65_20950 [Alkalilimnicola ehrlichii]